MSAFARLRREPALLRTGIVRLTRLGQNAGSEAADGNVAATPVTSLQFIKAYAQNARRPAALVFDGRRRRFRNHIMNQDKVLGLPG